MGQLFRRPTRRWATAPHPRQDYANERRGVRCESSGPSNQPASDVVMSRVPPAALARYPEPSAEAKDSCPGGKSETEAAGARDCRSRAEHCRSDRLLGRAGRTTPVAAFGDDVVKVESIQRPDGAFATG